MCSLHFVFPGKIEKMYDEYTNLHISDVTFFPSDRGRSYDLYASSVKKNDVLYLSLLSGKVEMIEGELYGEYERLSSRPFLII